MPKNKKKLTTEEIAKLLTTLATRFEKNMARHPGLKWEKVQERLEGDSRKLWSLNEMEKTGGEPDVISLDQKTGEYVFCDCSAESPKGRRSLCYDKKALESRKEFKPKDSAVSMAATMGIELLTEAQYKELQELGEFDLKTSSWIVTPVEIRNFGGAIFGDRRYNHVFTYHNGAESYYAARGFRGLIRI